MQRCMLHGSETWPVRKNEVALVNVLEIDCRWMKQIKDD